jgi:hypothetical protein
MVCEAHDPSITANKPTMTQRAVVCISTLSERKTTLAPKTGIRLSRYYFAIVYNSSSAPRPTKQTGINKLYLSGQRHLQRSCSRAMRARRNRGQYRQAAGAGEVATLLALTAHERKRAAIQRPLSQEGTETAPPGGRCNDIKALILIVWCNIRVTTLKQCDLRYKCVVSARDIVARTPQMVGGLCGQHRSLNYLPDRARGGFYCGRCRIVRAWTPPLIFGGRGTPTKMVAVNLKHQTAMIVTGVASNWEYFSLGTNQSLNRQSAFSGGSHD